MPSARWAPWCACTARERIFDKSHGRPQLPRRGKMTSHLGCFVVWCHVVSRKVTRPSIENTPPPPGPSPRSSPRNPSEPRRRAPRRALHLARRAVSRRKGCMARCRCPEACWSASRFLVLPPGRCIERALPPEPKTKRKPRETGKRRGACLLSSILSGFVRAAIEGRAAALLAREEAFPPALERTKECWTL